MQRTVIVQTKFGAVLVFHTTTETLISWDWVGPDHNLNLKDVFDHNGELMNFAIHGNDIKHITIT